jgi:single-stranded DNA-specific DHH superfamily exonuclease
MNIRFGARALAVILALAAAATSLAAQQTPAQGTHVQDSVRSKELNTQAYIQLLHTDLSAKQEQIVRETMQLNDQRAAIFWPIYREYQCEQSKLTTEKLALVADYSRDFSTMTDEKADQLAQQIMQLDEKRMALREKYYATMKKALSAILAVRFFQVEHQLQLIVDLQIAANLPIIEQNDAQ